MRRQITLPEIQDLITAGRIRPGMAKAEVRELLGPPEDWGGTSQRNREPNMWKYGEVEFWFDTHRVRMPWPGPRLTTVYVQGAEENQGQMLLGSS